jgi:hypothetical protein
VSEVKSNAFNRIGYIRFGSICGSRHSLGRGPIRRRERTLSDRPRTSEKRITWAPPQRLGG